MLAQEVVDKVGHTSDDGDTVVVKLTCGGRLLRRSDDKEPDDVVSERPEGAQ